MIVVIEIFVAVLVAVLFIFTTLALWLGTLGTIDAVVFGRCKSCGHFKLTSPSEGQRECAHCRHSQVPRPMAAVQHSRFIRHSAHR